MVLRQTSFARVAARGIPEFVSHTRQASTEQQVTLEHDSGHPQQRMEMNFGNAEALGLAKTTLSRAVSAHFSAQSNVIFD